MPTYGLPEFGMRFCNYYQRWHIKINGKWVNRSKAVWEHFNGPLPKGHVVHHLNHDRHDDRIENLQLMTRGEHASHHYDYEKMFTPESRQKISDSRTGQGKPRSGYNGR